MENNQFQNFTRFGDFPMESVERSDEDDGDEVLFGARVDERSANFGGGSESIFRLRWDGVPAGEGVDSTQSPHTICLCHKH